MFYVEGVADLGEGCSLIAQSGSKQAANYSDLVKQSVRFRFLIRAGLKSF
jgi:hypothetical protein